MAELALVVEEAEAEFDSLRQLFTHSEAQSDGQFMLGAQARVAAANAGILYIGAAFEEAVRQLGEAYVSGLVAKTEISESRMNAIRLGLWERATSALTNKAYGTKDFDQKQANKNIEILRDFCIDLNNIDLMKENSVYNYRNMKAKEVNNVFKRLGISDISNKIGRCTEFRAFFVVDTVAKAQDEFILYLNEFYDVRNKATHELGAFRSQGSVDTKRYIEFFLIAINRLAKVLQEDLDSLS